MRKVIIVFIFILSFCLIKQISAQQFMGALSAGLNITQVDGDEIYGFRHYGVNVGPSVIIPFTKNRKWTITLELLYSQVGSYQKAGPNDTAGEPQPYYRLNLDYAEVPVLIHFVDKNSVAGGLGVSYGQLVNVKEWQHDSLTINSLQSPYKKSDICILADIKIKLWQRLWLNFRYSYSMVKIRTRTFHNQYYPNNPSLDITRYQYNNDLAFRLTWVFNQEIIHKKQTKPKRH